MLSLLMEVVGWWCGWWVVDARGGSSRGSSSTEVVRWWCGWQVVNARGGLSRESLLMEVVGGVGYPGGHCHQQYLFC